MRGASLVELLIAVAIALVVSAGAVRGLVDAADAFAWQPATSELSARAAAVARLLTDDLSAAGDGPRVRLDTGAGPLAAPEPTRLSSWLPPILPRVVGLDGADPDDTAAADRLSILTVADGAPQAAVRRWPPRWAFVPGSTCPTLVDGCGFGNGLPVLWLEPRPGFQLGETDAVDAAALSVAGVAPAADAAIVAGVEIVSYRFDAARGELLRGRAGGRGLPVAGHVVAFALEWWGDGAPPSGPRWPPGEESCVTLADGPWCGVAPFRFDADLFRVRRLRARLRFEADSDGARGRDTARTARPGSAMTPAREVHDLDVTVDVAPVALRVAS
jgi:hypothetical protein